MNISTERKVFLMDPHEDLVFQKTVTFTPGRVGPVVHTMRQFGIEAAEETEDGVTFPFTQLNYKSLLIHTYCNTECISGHL